jgi:hypothetical protein
MKFSRDWKPKGMDLYSFIKSKDSKFLSQEGLFSDGTGSGRLAKGQRNFQAWTLS